MGVYNNGPFSGFSGKVGNLVGASWRDKEVLKTRPRYRRNRKKSSAQEEQQSKFALAAKLTEHLTHLVKTSYGLAQRATARNIAYRLMLKEVIGGVYPNLTIDYSKLPVAVGKMGGALNPVATSLQPGKINFSWTDNSVIQSASPTDTAILVVFCEEMQELQFKVNGATRAAQVDELDVPIFSGKEVHAWVSFVSPDQKLASNSKYVGLVTVL